MEDAPDPLESLLAEDVQSLDRSKLAEFLGPYVRFDKTTKEMNFLADYENIVSNSLKIEVALIASKAMALIFGDPEGLTPSDLINKDIMPIGSVKSSIKKLSDARKIKKNKDGRYVVPNYRINEIINKVGKKAD